MILFANYDLFTMRIGEKPRNTIKQKMRKPRKQWRPTVFRCSKTLKTSWTYPRWERDPNLMGQKNTGSGVV